jgi:GTPase KRas protein
MVNWQEEYTALRDEMIRFADAFILAYSVTSRTSFSNIRTHNNEIKEKKEKMRVAGTIKLSPSQRPCNSPVILVGTKNDLETQREVSVEEGQMLAKSLNCPFIETSAKLNTDIEKMFHEIVRCYRRQNPPAPSESERPTPSQSRKGLGRLLGSRQRNDDNGPRCIVI